MHDYTARFRSCGRLLRKARLETVLDGFIQEEVGLFAITPARRLASPAVGNAACPAVAVRTGVSSALEPSPTRT